MIIIKYFMLPNYLLTYQPTRLFNLCNHFEGNYGYLLQQRNVKQPCNE